MYIFVGIAVVALVIVVAAAVVLKTALMLTIASGMAAVVLLTALAIALIKILKALQAVDYSVGKIAMGVNAIATETSALPSALEGVNGTFVPLRDGLRQVVETLKSIAGKL